LVLERLDTVWRDQIPEHKFGTLPLTLFKGKFKTNTGKMETFAQHRESIKNEEMREEAIKEP
jgi:hypothetical protein